MRWIAVLVMSLMLAVPAKAQEDEIRGVISGQIDSFLADDFATAFTFAAPNIQTLFRTPENFARMVTNGYPMVHRPAEVQFQDLQELGGVHYQRVLIRDATGDYYLAEYSMVMTGPDWKIAGVRIVKAPGVGV